MSKAIKIGDTEIELKLTNRAEFRLGELANPPQLHIRHKAYHGICSWVWAMLPRELEAQYPKPEDLADVITIDRVAEFGAAVADAIYVDRDTGKDGTSKNGKPGSTQLSASKPGSRSTKPKNSARKKRK